MIKKQSIMNYKRSFMKRIRNSLNYTAADQQREFNSLPSLTVPDQSLSVQQLMARNAQGLSTFSGQVPMYALNDDEFDELPDVKRLDLTELEELREQNERYIKEYRDNVQKQKALDHQKILDAEFERKYQERKAKEDSEKPKQE